MQQDTVCSLYGIEELTICFFFSVHILPHILSHSYARAIYMKECRHKKKMRIIE